ncbi:MAG: single-stranded DNA-specific DHH superfamily exonuclease [Candidatus Nanohaloarchaea archaeon]|jgi:single-stranded DNA-specific DHH superfamily exonuclease
MKTEELKPAIDYLGKIDEDDQVVIIHHWDMDGISSSAIISKILEQERGRPADEVTIPHERSYHLTEKDHKLLEDATKLIVLDFNLQADELENLEEEFDLDVLVVDHHSFDREPDVDFVNPRAEDAEVYIPCSKICMDIAAEFGLEDEVRWIAGLGVIQDFGVDSCPELFEELEENYDMYLPEELTQQQLAKNCEYGRYSSVLNIKPYRDSKHYSKLAYQALMNSKDLKELEAQEEYRKVYEVYLEMQDEFNDAVENYEEDREIDREKMIIFFDIDSDFHITSSIATNMSTKTPEWVHLVIQKDEDEINISARCQSGRVDLGKLMQEALPEGAVEDGGEAGGHQKAAGASMKPKYLEEFKENFTELVE